MDLCVHFIGNTDAAAFGKEVGDTISAIENNPLWNGADPVIKYDHCPKDGGGGYHYTALIIFHLIEKHTV